MISLRKRQYKGEKLPNGQVIVKPFPHEIIVLKPYLPPREL